MQEPAKLPSPLAVLVSASNFTMPPSRSWRH
uniref:Uncharacterized protein n=1 Tax=Rhizophora mucronata TaxID=61149 RepID=A0A2P2MVA2_RHIMU